MTFTGFDTEDGVHFNPALLEVILKIKIIVYLF